MIDQLVAILLGCVAGVLICGIAIGLLVLLGMLPALFSKHADSAPGGRPVNPTPFSLENIQEAAKKGAEKAEEGSLRHLEHEIRVHARIGKDSLTYWHLSEKEIELLRSKGFTVTKKEQDPACRYFIRPFTLSWAAPSINQPATNNTDTHDKDRTGHP